MKTIRDKYDQALEVREVVRNQLATLILIEPKPTNWAFRVSSLEARINQLNAEIVGYAAEILDREMGDRADDSSD